MSGAAGDCDVQYEVRRLLATSGEPDDDPNVREK
jgi:hypothetical protein